MPDGSMSYSLDADDWVRRAVVRRGDGSVTWRPWPGAMAHILVGADGRIEHGDDLTGRLPTSSRTPLRLRYEACRRAGVKSCAAHVQFELSTPLSNVVEVHETTRTSKRAAAYFFVLSAMFGLASTFSFEASSAPHRVDPGLDRALGLTFGGLAVAGLGVATYHLLAPPKEQVVFAR